MDCFYCGKPIERLNIDGINVYDMTIIPLDRPYVNIVVHKQECLPHIDGYGKLKYLQENIERIYDVIGNKKSMKSTWNKNK